MAGLSLSLSLFLFRLLILLRHGTPAAAAAAAAADSASSKPTAYEVLQSYDFPPGILPLGVVDYDLDNSTGDFSAYIKSSCSFSIRGSYQLRYQTTISGRIARDRLSSLSGVTVKVLFFWVNIIEVDRRGDRLEFSVGILSAEFGIDNFLESPRCGCGFDCISLALPGSAAATVRTEEVGEEEGYEAMRTKLRGAF